MFQTTRLICISALVLGGCAVLPHPLSVAVVADCGPAGTSRGQALVWPPDVVETTAHAVVCQDGATPRRLTADGIPVRVEYLGTRVFLRAAGEPWAGLPRPRTHKLVHGDSGAPLYWEDGTVVCSLHTYHPETGALWCVPPAPPRVPDVRDSVELQVPRWGVDLEAPPGTWP